MTLPSGPSPYQVQSLFQPPPPSPPSSIPSRDISLTFQTDYARLVENATLLATFKTALIFRVAAAAAVAPPSVVLTRLYSGSLSTDLRVYVFLPGSNGSLGLNANAIARLATIVAAPSAIFDTAFFTQFGITRVSAVSLEPVPSTHQNNHVAIIAGSVSGTVFLLGSVIAVFIIYRRKSQRQNNKETDESIVHAASFSTVLFTTDMFNVSFASSSAHVRTNLQPRLQAGSSHKRFLRNMGRGAVSVVKNGPLQIIFEDDEELSVVEEGSMLMPGVVVSEQCLKRISDLDRLTTRMQLASDPGRLGHDLLTAQPAERLTASSCTQYLIHAA